MKKKCTRSPAEIFDVYQKTRSIWRAGAELGISGQRVQQILVASGYRNRMSMRPWSEVEAKTLRDRYEGYVSSAKLQELAAQMGRTKPFLCRQARALGLTNHRRQRVWLEVPASAMGIVATAHGTMSNKDLGKLVGLSCSGVEKRISKLGLGRSKFRLPSEPKHIWQFSPHPRGMLGKKHSLETRARFSERSKRMWADPLSKARSPENAQRRSDHAMAMLANGKFRQRYSHSRAGMRADLGQYFRSSWEANYARYLNFLKAQGQISSWQYEPDTFWFHEIKRGSRSYTPDFKVFENGGYHYDEIKGWMDAKSKTKLARMAKYYPGEEVRLIEKGQYYEIRNKLARLLPGWEK